MLRRLAKEISSRTGLVVITIGIEEEAVVRMILFDRGGIVDEYASVPEFHGPLPPGEVVALHANPVVVERYTGASQASVRAAAPIAGVPSDLPPARELLAVTLLRAAGYEVIAQPAAAGGGAFVDDREHAHARAQPRRARRFMSGRPYTVHRP